MLYSKCGSDNREGRKFCANCGAPIIAACPKCGTHNQPGERFCGECGAPLQVGAARVTALAASTGVDTTAPPAIGTNTPP
jgi:uncharacterized membrane protein YvbJ